MNGLDPSITQDFLTESGELIERLEGDLVTLERDPRDPEMLNQVFRALHTIKGSASFLALTNLVAVAHAAEGALNSARNRVVVVDRAVMDLLLQAIDLIKRQLGEVRDAKDLTAGPPDLIAALTAISEGRQAGAAPAAAAAPPTAAAPTGVEELVLPAGKADLVEYLVADMEETMARIGPRLAELAAEATRAAAAVDLSEQCEALGRAVDFFGVEPLTALVRGLTSAVGNLGTVKGAAFEQSLPRCAAVLELVARQAAAIKRRQIIRPAFTTLLERLETASDGGELDEAARLAPSATAAEVLVVDGVDTNGAAPAGAAAGTAGPSATVASAIPVAALQVSAQATVQTTGPSTAQPAPASGEARPSESKADASKQADQTIRVEVGRLESLMNLVGELVLQKNRIAALSRGLNSSQDPQASREALVTAAGGLDRVTGDIQVAVMRTRMQPLDKLFGRYPRLIRDLCQKTGKKMELVIEGGETEVDKSVIEELNDPLVHLLRNSADHGIESPETRRGSGKDETGTIRLVASHEGSHVRILVKDDGKGLVRDVIARKAVERGLVDQATLPTLTDRQVFDFIFLPGFSTADKVSDLSGRGVGMDVVRTNVRKLKGEIELSSTAGQGTTVSITIPLTVAILPAMMVGVGAEVYAVPLGNIIEIVKPEPAALSTIGSRRVLRLRKSVLPLVSSGEVFGLSGSPEDEPFAVVLAAGERQIGLMVSRLIGQQEVVVKPLDVSGQSNKAVSGATVRDDGGVSLIVDVNEVFRLAQD